ncbi:MAG: GAF domain-containing protein [Oscillochloridaceae bacterium]|nr:GAF domain-containing protein [Chloroflexaceae bacterium]MDW8390940.1 GAF domain-containing protein [Oscillochloridaceae bacterium]
MQFLARSSLQRKLILAFAAVLLIPTLILSIYHLVEMRLLLMERASLEYRQRAAMHAGFAKALIASAAADLLAVAGSPSLLDDPFPTDLSIFLQQRDNPYQALCVFPLSASERRCLRSPFPGNRIAWIPVVEVAPAGVVHAAREALAGEGRSGAQSVTTALIDGPAPGAPVLSLLTLVQRQEGEPLAVTLELPAQALFDLLVETEHGVCTTIVDAAGTSLYRSVACRPDAPGALSVSAPRPRDGLRILGNADGVLVVSQERPQTLQVIMPVQPPGQTGLEWTVIYALPLSAITGRIWRSEAMIAVITLGALLIALMAAMRLACDIVRPVRALAAAAERVGNGDLQATIPVTGDDEVGALGRTLDRTVARLRDAIAATESRRQEAETLRAAMQALSSTLDLKQVLDLILSELRKVVPYDSASVQVVRDGYAEIIGAYGLRRGEEVIGFRFDLAPGLTPNAEVAASRAPVILDDAPARYPHFNSEPYNADPIHSWLGVPLIFGERLTGMLTLDKFQPGFFTREHARLAAAFATQAAIALENARLYEEARRELAERQRVEAEQRQSQKMEALGRLAGGIAHDFNNVLTVILGEVGLLLDDLPSDDPRRHGLEQILQSGGRAAALIRQLLAFSRRQVLQPELLNLNEVITGMEQMLRRLIGEDIMLTILLSHDLPPVLADRGQIEQVVMNLVINARDAMPQGGQLVIQTASYYADVLTAPHAAGTRLDRYALLTVTDTGTGIDPAVQPHIFEPFFTTKPRDKGTGLGLAMVHGIVQQSGGFIRFSSRVNHGTTFEIYLPAATEAAPDTPASAPRPDTLRVAGATVLLVEDDAAVRQLASQILRRAGFTVLEAGNGHRALQLADQHAASIDLLLTDIVMPEGLNGVQLADAIRARRPNIAVVYMSGYTDDARIEAAHGERFIQKPFTPEVLIGALNEVLGAHAPLANRANGRAVG